MNSRGGPPIKRGGPPIGTISKDLAVHQNQIKILLQKLSIFRASYFKLDTFKRNILYGMSNLDIELVKSENST